MASTVLIGSDDGAVTEKTVSDNYLLIAQGTANITNTTVYRSKDGTFTHVITVKGIKP